MKRKRQSNGYEQQKKALVPGGVASLKTVRWSTSGRGEGPRVGVPGMSPTGDGLCDAGEENDEMLAWCGLRVVNLVALSASVLPNSRKEGRLGTRGMGLATLISPSACIYRG